MCTLRIDAGVSFRSKWADPQNAVYLVGTLCFGLGVVHLLTEGEGLGTVLEAGIICSISGVVLVTGYQLPHRRISTVGQWRTVWLGVGVMVSFAMLALSIWMIWRLEDRANELFFLVAFAATLGAAVGTRSGMYSIESEERLNEAEDLTKLLTINQRVLRHNLRNELAVSFGFLNKIETAGADEDVTADVQIIKKHLRKLLRTSDRTREIVSIRENDNEKRFDLSTVVEEQVARIREQHPQAAITTRFDDDCTVSAHAAFPKAIREALTNAVEHNAADIEITVSVQENQQGAAVVEIVDTGEGIPKFDIEAIEGPQETQLKHTQGLGLWIIYWTVKMSDGTLELSESTPNGTVVRITLPQTR